MTIQVEITVDLPVTEDQAGRFMHEIALPEARDELPVKVSHGLQVGRDLLPGRWHVYAVRREFLNGVPQHYVSLRWEAPVT